MDTVCEKWSLPKVRQPPAAAPFVPLHCRIPVSIDAPPTCVPHDLDRRWQSDRGRLWVQVDCRSVAELCNGRAYLAKPELRPLFTRIGRALFSLYTYGLRPLGAKEDLVIWTPREYNTVADHAVNCALDLETSWSRSDNDLLAQAMLSGRSLRLSVDGGKRSATQAAIGLALFSVEIVTGGVAKYTLLARSGKLLSGVSSAFLAEAMALEWGLQYMVELFKGKVTVTSESQ